MELVFGVAHSSEVMAHDCLKARYTIEYNGDVETQKSFSFNCIQLLWRTVYLQVKKTKGTLSTSNL